MSNVVAFGSTLLIICIHILLVIGQDVKIWPDYSNVCGGAITTPKKSGEFVSYLGDFNSSTECQQTCISLSSINNRCESYSWFSNTSNDTQNKFGCYARFKDPLWLPCVDGGVMSAEIYWPCTDDIDCSLNGKCLSNGTCSCRAAWTGARCQLLNFLPSPSNAGYKGQATSSWGGSVLRNDNDDSYHMFLSYFPNYCGHTADTMNSHVAHAISSNGYEGPYKIIGQLAQEWSHEPFATRGPNGEAVVYFSYTRNEPFWPILCNCSSNFNGTTTTQCCQQTPNACDYKKPSNLTRHTTVMRYSTDLSSNEWSEIKYLWPKNETGPTNQDTNFAAIIFPNGTVFGFNRMWTKEKGSVLYYVHSSDWNDTSKYVEEFNNTLFPQWVYPGCEDQFIYQDKNGYFHFLFHNMIPGYTGGHDEYFSGAHACSKDGYSWTFFGYAYDNNVTYDDGTYHTFQSTERPHLIFDKDGVTPIALTNGAIVDGNSANNDRSYTILRLLNRD